MIFDMLININTLSTIYRQEKRINRGVVGVYKAICYTRAARVLLERALIE